MGESGVFGLCHGSACTYGAPLAKYGKERKQTRLADGLDPPILLILIH